MAAPAAPPLNPVKGPLGGWPAQSEHHNAVLSQVGTHVAGAWLHVEVHSPASSLLYAAWHSTVREPL